ncbi:MAG: malectin domain-containing carbohydrate-binding protein [Bacteroidota bacterium]|nr:malectin domain-containing carbohydrate-binding protein [Bacteroidota bacterium]
MVRKRYFNCFLILFFLIIISSSESFSASIKYHNTSEDINRVDPISLPITEVLYSSIAEIFEKTEIENESEPFVDVDNLDKFPAKDHLTFSRIQIPWARSTGPFNANHDLVTVRITNKGLAPLRIDNLAISNNNYFVIENIVGTTYSGSFPVNLNSRQFIDVTVKFIAENPGTWKWIKILHENLTIISNDPKNPEKLVYLHGLWQLQGEDKYEPTAQDMLDAFGFKTRTGFAMKDPDKGNPTKLKGDEVFSPYFVRADPNQPVYARQMAAYHGCCNDTETLRYNIKGTKERTNIFTHRKEDGQSLLPRLLNSNNPAEKSFTPHVEVFGLNVGKDYTDPALNTFPEPYDIDNNKIGIRVWKVLDAQGKIIPNAFIIANDYLGGQWTNYDYNDNMYFISNIKPEIGTAYYSELNSTPSSLDFGSKETGSTNSITVNLESLGKTYSNGTSDPVININKVEIVGIDKSSFSFSAPASSNLNPQASTTLTVQYKPTTSGFKIADLLIHYNMSESPLRIPLYGIATDDCKEITEHLKIKSGSNSSVTSNGITWLSDTPYRKGNIKLDVPPSYVNSIAGTDDDVVYINYLSSNTDLNTIRYKIPLTDGDYMVRLHFSENYWKNPGERVFTISMENEIRLANFDILREVKPKTALVKNFPVTVSDQVLNIEFTATVNRLSIAAVEVYKVNDGAGITVSATAQSTSCELDNGVINASAANSQQISYKLGADGTYQSSGTFENLSAGSYTVFAKAASDNCEASLQVLVEEGGCPNEAPTVGNSINDQAAKEESEFSYTFPVNTFIDPDQDDELTYTATLADNSDLPLWLSFNPLTRTFSGTPGKNDVGTIEIKVTATDKRAASISDYFLLVIYNKNEPFIEEIADIITQQDSPIGPITFIISSGDQDMSDLSLIVSSDNVELIPTQNTVLAGDGEERTFTITPVSGKFGIANVTITLEGVNTETSRTFKVTVLKLNDFPTISAIDDVNILINTSTGPIEFVVADEDNEEQNLNITAVSDNQELIPDGNIILGGSGSNRTIMITPAEDKTGVAKITIQVYDGESMAISSFNVRVSPITSIANENLESKIKLFPNPAQNDLTVQLENSFMGTTDLILLDARGKVLRKYTFEKNSKSIGYGLSLEPYSSGTYIIKIQQQGTVTFRRFIKY